MTPQPIRMYPIVSKELPRRDGNWSMWETQRGAPADERQVCRDSRLLKRNTTATREDQSVRGTKETAPSC